MNIMVECSVAVQVFGLKSDSTCMSGNGCMGTGGGCSLCTIYGPLTYLNPCRNITYYCALSLFFRQLESLVEKRLNNFAQQDGGMVSPSIDVAVNVVNVCSHMCVLESHAGNNSSGASLLT